MFHNLKNLIISYQSEILLIRVSGLVVSKRDDDRKVVGSNLVSSKILDAKLIGSN